MTVRTKELGRLAAIGDATARTIYTCPAGRTAIVKDVAYYTTSTTVIRVGVKRAGVVANVWSGKGPTSESSLPRAVWVVLEPGDELEVQRVSGTTAYDVVCSGTELDGVAT